MRTTKASTSLIFLSYLLLVASTATAFDIATLLARDPRFSNFSDYLTKNKVDLAINHRSAVTVLAIPNDKIGDLAGKPDDVLLTILRTHVVLDYFDILKIQKLNGKPTITTTLFQSTGVATYEQGYLNITKNSKNQVVFASAVKGAPHDVLLMGSVASQPFNVSVLEVSGHIIVPGIEAFVASPPPPVSAPPPSKAKVPAPAPSTAEAPSPSDDDDATSPSSDSPTEAPKNAPAPSPDSSAPASEQPAADAAVADAAKPPTSASSKNLGMSSLGFLVVLASFFGAY